MGASVCYYLGGLFRLRSSSGSAQQRPANVLFEIFFERFFLPYEIVVALASMFYASCHYCVLSYSERAPLRCFIPMAHFLVVSFAGSGLGGASSIRTISIQFATLPINSFFSKSTYRVCCLGSSIIDRYRCAVLQTSILRRRTLLYCLVINTAAATAC